MDLQVLARVVWRFRYIVLVGTMLAVSLAFLSFVRVDIGGKPLLSYRETEQWESLSTIFVTSRGFPWGSVSATPEGETTSEGADPVDPGRLTTLAAIYMKLAQSDAVLSRIAATDEDFEGSVQTFPVFAESGGPQLPLITLSAVSASPGGAQDLGRRYLTAFLNFLREKQVEGRIPLEDRVQFQVLREPQPANLLAGRRKTRPILIFLGIMSATIGLALLLENLRPRERPAAGEPVLLTDDAVTVKAGVTPKAEVARAPGASRRSEISRRTA
jgi:hypothetical protein